MTFTIGPIHRVLFILLFCGLSGIRLFFKLRYHAINLKPVSRTEGAGAGVIRIVLGLPLLFATFITCFLPDPYPWMHVPIPAVLSIAGFVAGLLILTGLVYVHLYLGDSFSTTIEAVGEQRRLVTTGPYRYVRHPMYALYFALFLAAFGVSGNWVVGLCGVAIIASLMILRVPKEERLLIEHHGKKYHDYASLTPRFLPSTREIRKKIYNNGSLRR